MGASSACFSPATVLQFLSSLFNLLGVSAVFRRLRVGLFAAAVAGLCRAASACARSSASAAVARVRQRNRKRSRRRRHAAKALTPSEVSKKANATQRMKADRVPSPVRDGDTASTWRHRTIKETLHETDSTRCRAPQRAQWRWARSPRHRPPPTKPLSRSSKVTGINWFNRMDDGVKEFAQGKHRASPSYQTGPGRADAAQQLKIIEDLIAKKVTAIAVVLLRSADARTGAQEGDGSRHQGRHA